MAVTRVQSANATVNTRADATVPFGSNVVAGNAVLVLLNWVTATGAGAVTVVSVTDTQGNTYTAVPNTLRQIVGVRYANLYTQIFAATAAVSGPCSVTALLTAAPLTLTASLHETTPAHVDAGAGATGTTATPNAGSLTPSANGAFLAAACIMDNGFGFGSGWFTAGAGWTLGVQAGGGNESSADEYQAQATAAPVTGDFVSGFPGISGPWTASYAVLIPGAGAVSQWTIPAGQANSATSLTSGITITLSAGGGTPQPGDVAWVAAQWYGGGATGTTGTCQDNNGKPYTVSPSSPATYDSGCGQMHHFYRLCTGGEGDTVTVTFANTFVVSSIRFVFFRPSTPATFDGSARATGTGTPVNAPTVPVTGTADLVVTSACCNGGVTVPNAPWTATVGTPGNFGEGYAYALNIAAPLPVNFTAVAGAGTWTATGMSFKLAGSSGGGGGAVLQPLVPLGRELTIDTPLVPRLGGGGFA